MRLHGVNCAVCGMSFRERYGPCIDGIVFHFRAESDPAGYIPGYDPKSFDMYAEVMRQEFSRVREVMGDKAVLAGIYIWYYKGGWGVMTPESLAAWTEA